MSGIESEIGNWNNKSSADIEGIFNRYRTDKLLKVNLINLLQKVELQIGVSWLLKRFFEEGGEISRREIASIISTIPTITSWEARLHMLQCIPHMPIDDSQKKKIELFLRQCLTENNKFVRAWAYNGMYELTSQHPEYLSETRQLFDLAMKDESPSVKARIRNILKKGF